MLLIFGIVCGIVCAEVSHKYNSLSVVNCKVGFGVENFNFLDKRSPDNTKPESNVLSNKNLC